MSKTNNQIDIDSFWEYSDPAVSERRFRDALRLAQGGTRLELLTQIARTYGLRGQFDQAHQILDKVETQLEGAGLCPKVRYLLERGRSFNSSGEKIKARSLFIKAWELGKGAELEGLAVDAAHMVAITYSGEPDAILWNRRGLELAHKSEDSKARSLIPAILNNSAWDLHDMERYGEALPMFEAALEAWKNTGKQSQIRIARWSVARCLRSLERYNEALVILRELETEYAAIDSVNGFVFEEIAENLSELDNHQGAQHYFRRAYDELRKDEWLVKNQSDRLARLKSLTGVD